MEMFELEASVLNVKLDKTVRRDCTVCISTFHCCALQSSYPRFHTLTRAGAVMSSEKRERVQVKPLKKLVIAAWTFSLGPSDPEIDKTYRARGGS